MADFFKKQWAIVAVLASTLVVAGVVGWFILDSASTKERLEGELSEVKGRKEQINSCPYQLTGPNRATAEKNATVAWDNYERSYNEIAAKFKVANFPQGDVAPAQAKLLITNRCQVMKEQLEQAGVKYSDSVGKFTFSSVVDGEELPSADDIKFHLRNLRIIQEIVVVLADCKPKMVDAITRADLKLLEKDKDYKYMPLTLKVTGTYPSVQRIFNRLQDAKYLLIIRKVEFSTADMVTAGGATSEKATLERPDGRRPAATAQTAATAKVGAPKHERIVFRNMASVAATFEFDYVELLRHNPKSGKKRRKK